VNIPTIDLASTPVELVIKAGPNCYRLSFPEVHLFLENQPPPPEENAFPLATSFRLPMKNPDLEWYEASQRYGPYVAQARALLQRTPFAFLLPHPALCADWNLESGGNTDLGQPLVAPFSGQVTSAYNWAGSVGRVIQIVGITPAGEVIVWAGWHLASMAITTGQTVHVGNDIGAIGNADGYYAGAHLHEQLCILNYAGIPKPNQFSGSDRRYNWQSPPAFYKAHGVDPDLVDRCTRWK